MSSLSHVHVEVAIKDEFAAARRQIEALAQHASGPNLVASPRCWRPQPVKIRTPTCENPIARQAGGGPASCPASNNCLRCLGQSLSYFAIVIRAARAATQD